MQHVGEVALIALFLMDWMNQEWEKCSPWDPWRHSTLFSEGEVGVILRRALVHDIEEIVTGDIARPTKYSDNDLAVMLKKLEKKAAKAVIETYELPTKWLGSWENAKEGDEGLIIKVADALSVVLTCYREINLYSNNHFRPVRKEAINYIANLIKYIDSISKKLEELEYENQFIMTALIDFLESAKKLLMEGLQNENINR